MKGRRKVRRSSDISRRRRPTLPVCLSDMEILGPDDHSRQRMVVDLLRGSWTGCSCGAHWRIEGDLLDAEITALNHHTNPARNDPRGKIELPPLSDEPRSPNAWVDAHLAAGPTKGIYPPASMGGPSGKPDGRKAK